MVIRKCLDPAVVAQSIEAVPNSLLYGRGWMLHPGSLWPRPSAGEQGTEGCLFETFSDTGVRGRVADPSEWEFKGHVYPDGSCMPHVLSELRRAAWAAVEVSDMGSVRKVASGVVPSYIRQTAYAAEWCSAAVVAQLANGACDVAQDCKGVVSEWQKPPKRQLRADSVHAGQARELHRHPSRVHVTMRWIRGHARSTRWPTLPRLLILVKGAMRSGTRLPTDSPT